MLQGKLYHYVIFFPDNIDGFRIQGCLVFIEILDKRTYPPFILKFVPFFSPFIFNTDQDPFIKKGQLPQAV